MFALLVKSVLIITLLLSSIGGPAASSATTLPGSPIYPVKLVLEEARLSMTNNVSNQIALHLAFAGERAQEMAGLAAQNRAPSAQLLVNYQAHWREAVRLAGQMPDEELQPVMTKAQHMARAQEALLAQAQVGATNQVRARLQEAEESLAQVQLAVTLGLENQNTYRWRVRYLPEEWPGEGEGFGFGPGGSYSPGPGYGSGSNEAPYGPGECPNPEGCDGEGPYGPYGPGDGEAPYGPGECPNPGDCDGEGPYGPYGPGNGEAPYGPGECPNPGDCDGEGPYGPGNENPGPSGPGNGEAPYGPGECPNPGDCDGEGPYGPGNENPGPSGPGNDDPGPDRSRQREPRPQRPWQ